MAITVRDLETLQNAAVALGNGAIIDVKAFGSLVLGVSGTFVATITFEGSLDDVTYTAVRATDMTGGAAATTATAPGLFLVPTEGLSSVRARISAYTSGSITVLGRPAIPEKGNI